MNTVTYAFMTTVTVSTEDQHEGTIDELRDAMEDALTVALPNKEIVVTFEDCV